MPKSKVKLIYKLINVGCRKKLFTILQSSNIQKHGKRFFLCLKGKFNEFHTGPFFRNTFNFLQAHWSRDAKRILLVSANKIKMIISKTAREIS
jgi:hypothetical protein